MVCATYDADSRTGRIVLQPNRSWTWRANVLFLAGFAGVSLAIGLSFLVRGYWMILPFNLLELAVVSACLYHCVRRTHLQEVLTFSEDELLIERGIRGPQTRHLFKRLFARFFVRRPRHPWYGTRVAVRSHGREVEIGNFLSPDDKSELIEALRSMVSSLGEEPALR